VATVASADGTRRPFAAENTAGRVRGAVGSLLPISTSDATSFFFLYPHRAGAAGAPHRRRVLWRRTAV